MNDTDKILLTIENTLLAILKTLDDMKQQEFDYWETWKNAKGIKKT